MSPDRFCIISLFGHENSLIGLKDPSTRQVFEVKLQSEKPAKPGDVVKSLKEILRSRVRAEQIDEASSDTPALSATQCGECDDELPPALAAVASKLTPEQLKALKAAIADPAKGGAGKGKGNEKLKIPRGLAQA